MFAGGLGLILFHRLLLAAAAQSVSPPNVVVLTSSAVEAYAGALEGLKSGLEKAPLLLSIVDLAGPDAEARLIQSMRLQPRLIVAIGTDSTLRAASQDLSVPVVSTMVLLSETEAA